MGKQNPKIPKRQLSDSDSDLDSSDDETVTRLLYSERDTCPRFLVMEAKGDRTLASYSPFLLEKGLKGKAGELKDVKKLRSGALLIECSRKTQAINLMTSTKLADIPVTCSAHKTLNFCKGLIRDRDRSLADETIEEIVSELRSQGVIEAKRFTYRKDGRIFPSNTYLLTFDTTVLPNSIKVGCFSMPVDLYIPRPTRCFKCQKFGHGQNSCTRKATCFRCGGIDHDGNTCTQPLKCSNCQGDHMSSSIDCSEYKFQSMVQKIKYEQNISYFEARKQAKAVTSANTTGHSYASVVKTVTAVPTTSVHCQTDLSWTVGDKPKPVTDIEIIHPKTNTVIAPKSTQEASTSTSPEPAPQTVVSNTIKSPKKKFQTDRVSKALKDPVQLYNKFGSLEDMDTEVSPHSLLSGHTRGHSPKKKDRSRSPVTPP
ncbi:uncharacterized protein [Haliotis cracherodii]|uniref:uncharacterized protein n=1 Tax=Haliotis cracherodii TaxID=6455 RepID=UPI0039E9C198